MVTLPNYYKLDATLYSTYILVKIIDDDESLVDISASFASKIFKILIGMSNGVERSERGRVASLPR